MAISESTPAEVAAELAILIETEGRPETEAGMATAIDRVVAYAKSIAPVGTGDDPHPGQFRDAIHGQVTQDVDRRPAGEVVNNLRYAPFVEFGTSKTPEHATFAKTAAHMEKVFEQETLA